MRKLTWEDKRDIFEYAKNEEVSRWWDTKNSRAEIGYALSADFWNRGLMTEAVRKLIEFGFQRMDLVRIEAR